MATTSLLSHQDRTIHIAVDGILYAYTFPPGDHIRKVLVINKASPLQALNYAKRWATSVKKVEHA